MHGRSFSNFHMKMAGTEAMDEEQAQCISPVMESENSEQSNLELNLIQKVTTVQPEHHSQTGDQGDRLLKLPMSRIKIIMKMDPDVNLASQEAVVTIAKATELFIGAVSKDASFRTVQAKRKTLLRKDLEHIFDTRDCYAFLEGTMES